MYQGSNQKFGDYRIRKCLLQCADTVALWFICNAVMESIEAVGFIYATRKSCKFEPRMILVGELLQTLEHVDFVENGRMPDMIMIGLHGDLQRSILACPAFQVSNRHIPKSK